MGRKGPRAKTKTVLKSVSKWEQFGSMPNFKFQTLFYKNPPNATQPYTTTQPRLVPNTLLMHSRKR